MLASNLARTVGAGISRASRNPLRATGFVFFASAPPPAAPAPKVRQC